MYAGSDRFYDQTISESEASSNDGPLPGFDRYTEDELEYTWGNRLASLRWNHLFNERLFANLTLIYSQFSYESFLSYSSESSYAGIPVLAEQQTVEFQSEIRKEALRLDFDYFGRNHHWQWGGHLAQLGYTPGISGNRQLIQQLDSLIAPPTEVRDTVQLQTLEAGLYFEDRMQWGKWEIIAGLHLATLRNESNTFWALQPRFRLFFQMMENWSLHASGSRTAQFLHLLSATNAGLPSDLWVPASEAMPPQYSWQTSMGCTGLLWEQWQLGLDLYWRTFRDIPQMRRSLLNSDASLAINADNWEEVAFRTDGDAYGLELLLRRQAGSLRPWLAYTLAHTNRRIGSLELPVPFDYRHRIAASLGWLPLANWQFSVSWQYFRSAPLSPVLDEQQEFSFLHILPTTDQSVGQSRLPDYHRLDLRATWTRRGEKLKHELSMGVYNLYNRTNGLFLLRQELSGTDPSFSLRQVNGFPILPSVRYQLSF